ncbi:RNA polymerase sigma factor CnrH [Rubripirellula tenax]|uniref:RNA polymerase sigma factor CnrH n=1 Tax=Rubripirellula tenax TaxID=2528015 RepID=A0A5C6FGS9_9BACT|nr:sigma-70 family RNA polymerase sigma factor [Rubripirellula tenax]TWU58869.1 RNA polymerase sigma factor CnrH [Rubripirellula tenax]
MPDDSLKPDREQFITNLTRHHDQLLGFIVSLVANWQDAQDVLQQTSIVLWRKYDQFDPATNFMDWASRVAFYESKNFVRLKARDRHYFNDDLLRTIANERVEDVANYERRAIALRSCLQNLRSGDRELITDVYEHGKVIGEVAGAIGIEVQSVYNRLYRLRKRVAECIQQTLVAEARTS